MIGDVGEISGLDILLSHCVTGGEPEWVVIARTRHKYIPQGTLSTVSRSHLVRVGSVATSLSLTVLATTTHPGSGHAGGIPNEWH